MNDAYLLRVESLTCQAVHDVIGGDAADLEAAVADIGSPALRADVEFFAELMIQKSASTRSEVA